jgi:hypothetical protein
MRERFGKDGGFCRELLKKFPAPSKLLRIKDKLDASIP